MLTITGLQLLSATLPRSIMEKLLALVSLHLLTLVSIPVLPLMMKDLLVATGQRSSSKVGSPLFECPSLLSIIIHVGSGMYLDSHGYFMNNSIVIAYSGYHCSRRYLYCYSDAPWNDIGHVRGYDGQTSSYIHLSVSR